MHGHKDVIYTLLSAASLGTWWVDFANNMHPILADLLLIVGIISGMISIWYMVKTKTPKI